MNLLSRLKINNEEYISKTIILDEEEKSKLYKRLIDNKVDMPYSNILDIDIKLEYTVVSTLIYIIDMFTREVKHLILYDKDSCLFTIVNPNK